ncbi:FAD-dependent oxidoreductase [Nocardia farcinica]|uniref:FAD-dependent oxidoreductase n=1 Tax=Nocardia farcinica TaxID=37329 RepID=UPI0024571162|nr:FAD-dependent monooxygenase [Nocardia farcinica]
MDNIAVIGGGLGGVAASIALRNAGFTTNVFESRPDFSELGVAVIISPNGFKALRSLGRGIADEVLAKGRPVTISGLLKVFHPNGEFMTTHRAYGDLEKLYGAPQVTIRRSLFHQILLDAHGRDGLHAGAELTSYADQGDSVTATFANGQTVETGLLIGADGLHSRVLRIMHVDEPPRYTGWSNLRGVTSGMTLPEGLEDGLTIIENQDHVMTVPVGREGDLYWPSAFEIEQGAWPRTPGEAHAEVLRRIEGWYFVEDLVKNVNPETLNQREIRDNVPLPFYSQGRVTLLGDAAHAMSNFWGQGANSSLEDVRPYGT